MKSLLIISSEFPPGPGGIGQHAFCLARALVNEGVKVYVLSPSDYASKNEIHQFDADQGFLVYRTKRLGSFLTYLHRFWLTYRLLRLHHFDHILLSGKFSLWQGWLIKMISPVKHTLAILHGSEVNLPGWLQRSFTHLSIAKADVLIPVSKFTRSLLPEFILKSHPKIQIIPNGIESISDPNVNTEGFKLKGAPVLLTVGHVSPRKGQHRLIRALPELLKNWPDIHYHIVGRPIQREALEKLAAELGVSSHISFHGRIEQHAELSNWYRAADVFVLLSENQPNGDVEGFGIVALEANLYGLPVIGAIGSGVEEAVCHHHSGYLVNGNSATEILKGIDWCLEHRSELQEGSRKWATDHRWSEIVKQYIPLFA